MNRLAMRCLIASNLFLFLCLGGFAQARKISGSITDQNGAPLRGVNVLIKGTKTGATTDANGKYEIPAQQGNHVLIFSFVGYTDREMSVGAADANVNVQLQSLDKALQEVVVVGYGDQRKKTLTTAVASVSGKQVKDLPVLNPSAALAGQVSGVNVQATNGAPGQPPVLRVRGTGSINAGNSPLYVVDGYPLPDNTAFNLINPQDIESMQVLKDAAACAIYGSRGGNGVVLVTTKKGSSGKTRFALNAYAGVQQPLKKVSVLNAPQLIDYMKDVFTNKGQAIPPQYANPAADLPNTDWQDEVFRTAPQQSYQLSASGGSSTVQYSVSGGYLQQDGIIKGTGYQRFNLRANVDAQLSKHIKLGVSLMPSYTVTNNKDTRGDGPEAANGSGGTLAGGASGIVTMAMFMPQLFPVKYANGNYGQPAIDPLYNGFSPNYVNPVALIDLYEDKAKAATFLGTAYLEAKIIEGLKFKSTFGFLNGNSSRNIFTPSTLGRVGYTSASITNPNLLAIAAQRQVGLNYNWISENYFTYSKRMGEHDLSVVAGYSAQQNVVTLETENGLQGSFLSDAVHTVAGAGQILATTSYSGNNMNSLYARLNYAFGDKYMLMASFRRDGSSRFGSNSKYASFPSVSAAWNIKEEKFMDKVGGVSALKLRASYGFTGNNSIGDYAWQSYLASTNYVLGTGNGTANYGYIPGGLSNPNLTWEKNQQVDLGLEAGFFKDRLVLDVDLYRRITSNLLLNRNVPAINGFALSIIENVGKVQNEGLEIGILSKNLVGRLKWNTNFNITFNNNKVLELVNHVPLLPYPYKIAEGMPLSEFWGVKQIGVYQDQKDVDNSPKWTANTMAPGDVKYEDFNHDGKVDANDMQYLGNAMPKFTFGMVNSFQYSNFDLNIIIRGSYGNKNWYQLDRSQFRFAGSLNPRTNVLDRWKSQTEPGNGMEPRAGGFAQDYQSDRYIHDASFLQIANLTLGYTVPEKIKAIESLRFYVSSQNLAMFTKKYPGYNPEANANNDAAYIGYDASGSYPLSRSFVLGLNLNF